jgi:stage II sporulation protein M
MYKKKSLKKPRLGEITKSLFRESLTLSNKLRNYFLFSLVLFMMVFLFGLIFPIFFKENVLSLIENLIHQTEGLNFLDLTSFIMFNNLKSAFFGMFLGIFLGIFPILTIILNGYVLGFVANRVVALNGGGVLWRLLPHGIFEIPAIMLSAGLGMYLGAFFITARKKIKSLAFLLASLILFNALVLIVFFLLIIINVIKGSIILNINELLGIFPTDFLMIIFLLLFFISFYFGSFILDKNDRKDFFDRIRNSLKVFIFIVVPLLVIAATIEGILIFMLPR